MNLLDRYLLRSVAPAVLVCLAALLSLSLFVEFAQQSRFAGQGQYTLVHGLAYAALRIPQFAFEALPAAAIIGSFLALGNLQAHHELTVARASGVSVLRLSAPVWGAGFLLVLLALFLGESLAPPMHALGKRMRATALNLTPALTQGEGVWMRDGDLILNLRPAGDAAGLASAFLFRLGPDGVSALGRAAMARINEDGRLELSGYAETVLEAGGGSRVNSSDAWVTETRLSPDIVELVELRPELMKIGSLLRYARYLESNQLNGVRFPAGNAIPTGDHGRRGPDVRPGLTAGLYQPPNSGRRRPGGAGPGHRADLVSGQSRRGRGRPAIRPAALDRKLDPDRSAGRGRGPAVVARRSAALARTLVGEHRSRASVAHLHTRNFAG